LVAALLLAAAPAAAESLNISFGHTSGAPSATYAAAGTAGTWNAVSGVAGASYPLVDITGAATGVSVSQGPTTTVLSATDGSVTGDDAALLNSGLVTTGAETCLMFSGVAAGTYEVLEYAWLPNQPAVKSRTRQDQAPTTVDVGGAWTGAHVEGVTYARYVVTVGADGQLPAHSGLVPNAPDSALNGVQIRPLSSGAVDAGTTGGGGGGGVTGPDAGVGGGGHHGSGCTAGGSTGTPLLIVLGVGLLFRRGRRRQSR
jgi:hypothetical protein